MANLHWVAVVAATEDTEDPSIEGFVRYIQRLVAYFYAVYGLLELTPEQWIQKSFDVLTDFFGRAGLRTNMVKTVSMVCQPCRTIGGHSA